tara:strand:+ start:2940 stop:3719 length:780 start_codon:yes stop_codon:yes gene_type:complete
MSKSEIIKGICLKVGPLGENDRLITLLTEHSGITRLAAPGARKPRSSLAATNPLTLLELYIVGKKSLKKVRQIRVLKSFKNISKSLVRLAAAQAIAELSCIVIGDNENQNDFFKTAIIHLERIDDTIDPLNEELLILAISIQSLIHLLALGGFNLPIYFCCKSNKPINPELDNSSWRCTFIPSEGFCLDIDETYPINLTSSEAALMQRLFFPEMPIKSTGELAGPKKVWIKLLKILEIWIKEQIGKELESLKMLKNLFI